MKNNIVLTGFMGVGKGNLSRALVRKLGMVAIDTDDIIESMENRSVKKIFKKEGEAYFRRLEERICDWIAASVSDTIVSTGGGFPIHVEKPGRMGRVFYLQSSFDGILARIYESPNPKKKLKKRPLFADEARAKKLFESRVERYRETADVVVDVEGKPLERIVSEVLAGR